MSLAGRPQCWPRANCDGCAYPLTVAHSLLAGPPGRRAKRPQCRPRANCDGCAYPGPAFSQCVTGLRGPGANSVGQGLTLMAVPTSGPLGAVTYCPLAERGAGRPQCRSRANCDGCAHTDRDSHTLTRAATAPQWAGGSGGLLDRSRRAPRRPGHVRLGQSCSKPPDPLPRREAVRTVAVSDSRLWN